jgi:hypothetical protein
MLTTGGLRCANPPDGLALGPRFRGGERGGYFFAPKLTPAGGEMSSGTKKSTCSGWLKSTRYWSKSLTPSAARNVSSIRKLPVKLLGLRKTR